MSSSNQDELGSSSPPSHQPSLPPPPLPPPMAPTLGPTIVAVPPPRRPKMDLEITPPPLSQPTLEPPSLPSGTATKVTDPPTPSKLTSPTSSNPNPSSVEEAAALLGACITRLSNQSVYRTITAPHGLHSSFSTVKPIPCSELYQRLSSLYKLLKKASTDDSDDVDDDDENNNSNSNDTLQAAPSIIPLLHKLLHISSSLALTPIYLHSSNSTVPQQPLPQQILHSTLNNNSNDTGVISAGASANIPTTSNVKPLPPPSPSSSPLPSSSQQSENNGKSSSSSSSSSSSKNNTKESKKKKLKNLQVPPVRITPPLTSKPIRHLWVQCITLAHRLSPPPPSAQSLRSASASGGMSSMSTDKSSNGGNNSPSNAFTPSASTNILTPYLSYAVSHPRSAKSSGGTRVASFAVLKQIFNDEILSKRFFNLSNSKQQYNNGNNSSNSNALLLNELLTTCFNGLKSSGSNDVVHRIHALECIISVFIAYRDNVLVERLNQNNDYQSQSSTKSTSKLRNEADETFLHWNDMEERTIQEAIKVLKRASDDKYSEVRNIASQFATVLSTMLLHEKHQIAHLKGGSNAGGSSTLSSSSSTLGLNYLDEVCQLCYRNLDDESAQVGIGWSTAMARCMSSAIEYHSHFNSLSSSPNDGIDSTASTSASTIASGGSSSSSHTSSFHQITSAMGSKSNDLASKFKAFNETRRILNSIASGSCLTLECAFQFLVSQFIRVGQNAVTSGGSGSSSGNSNSGGSGHSNSGGSGGFLVIDSSRVIRNGIGGTLVQLCRLQCSIGGIQTGADEGTSGGSISNTNHDPGLNGGNLNVLDPSHLTMDILMNMIGPAFEQQILTQENKLSSSGGSTGNTNSGIGGHSSHKLKSKDATSSPKRKIVEKSASAVGSFFGGGGGNNGGSGSTVSGSQSKKLVSSTSVAGMVRVIVGRVLRRGLSEMMTETMQLSLLRDFSSMTSTTTSGVWKLNKHQYQVAFIEISHIVSTLGEACASALDELIPSLQQCLSHPDHGVRFEAATAFQAVTVAFPSAGRKYIMAMVDEIQVHHDEILALANNREPDLATSSTDSPSPAKSKRLFRRNQDKSSSLSPSSSLAASTKINNAVIEKSLEHQYALHGNALVLSMILHVMPRLPGGLPSELLDIIIAVADNLVSCQGSGLLSQNYPGAIVTCVRAGYCIISGALTIGVKSTVMHLQSIFGIWAKSAAFIDGDLKRMGPMHDVSCLEPFINSIVVFLRVSSELLLSVPDALNRTSQILEKVIPVIMGYSQLESDDSNLFVSSRIDSAKAAIMEAFSWLPPGSFPLVADSVFSFASHQIKIGTENRMPCGLLVSLVSREDDLLDIRSLSRANSSRHTGGSITIEDSFIPLTSEYINHSQREAVLHFMEVSNHRLKVNSNSSTAIRDLLVRNESAKALPTPLHGVGTWIEPPPPSKSSTERLMNAAIHVFAATFGLQGSHQQTTAVTLMEDLVLSGRGGKLELVTAVNIVSTLLSCLRALPSNEGSDSGVVGTGPPWMSKMARLFFKLLTNPQPLVRRAAAEGLGILAPVGIKEDTHTLQSSILHSLEEMMQGSGNENALQQKNLYKIAGCLLTFGCIQRASSSMLSEDARNHSRSASLKHNDTSNAVGSQTPTMIMLTRLLPYTATHNADDESFLARTCAIRSFNMLLSNSKLLDSDTNSPEESHQILSKAIEVVENNFFAAWKTNIAEIDVRTHEVEKFTFELSFLASLIRLMSFLLPHLSLLRNDLNVAHRFSSMVTVMIELSDYHPSITLEGFAFYEVLYTNIHSINQSHLRPITVNEIFSSVSPIIKKAFCQQKLVAKKRCKKDSFNGCDGSLMCQIASVDFVRKLAETNDDQIVQKIRKANFKCSLFSLLESICGTRQYPRSRFNRTLASSLVGDIIPVDAQILELKLCASIKSLLYLDMGTAGCDTSELLNWLLFARVLFSGELEYHDSFDTSGDDNFHWSMVVSQAVGQANSDALEVTALSGNTVRWQVKHLAATIASITLTNIVKVGRDQLGNYDESDLSVVRQNIDSNQKSSNLHWTALGSHILLHLKDLLSVACSITTATIDQGELYTLQNSGLNFLSLLIENFAETVDPDDPSPEAKEKIIENFVSQIVPSVKHALSACDIQNDEDSITTEGARDLFINGCNTLCLIISKGLVSDGTSLRRILKPLVPFQDGLAFCPYPRDSYSSDLQLKPKSFIDNRMSVLLPRIGKVSCLAKLCVFGKVGLAPCDITASIYNEIEHVENEVAIMSAALAIDAYNLETVTNESKISDVSGNTNLEMKSGLTFPNMEDLSITVREKMIDDWALFAGFSSILLTKILKNEDEKNENYVILCSWLERLVDVVLAGLHTNLDLLDSAESSSAVHKAEQICTICLLVLDNIISSGETTAALISNGAKSTVLHCVLENIVCAWIDDVSDPCADFTTQLTDETKSELETKTQYKPDYDGDNAKALVTQVCRFVEHTLKTTSEIDLNLITSLSKPLISIQEDADTFNFDSSMKTNIITSHFRSFTHLLEKEEIDILDIDIVRCLFDLSLKKFILGKDDTNWAAISNLMQCCLAKEMFTETDKIFYAKNAACDGNWAAWELLCNSSNDINAFLSSSEFIRNAMDNRDDQHQHLVVLSALCNVSRVHADWIPDIMGAIGQQLLLLFNLYGTNLLEGSLFRKNRMLACSHCMKIVMISFQFMKSQIDVALPEAKTQAEADLAVYLSIIFETLISVIVFNGLPNQQNNSNVGADCSLGRMCAQFFGHVLRTSPASFKLCIGNLNDTSRGILESSVRAELSGYAVRNTAPAKKKLNIKNFAPSASNKS